MRTRHLDANGRPRYTNRLANEDSPYLLQHAHNPVDWFPWGDEAFDKARTEDKPVFLSIGYSTCHWCHVMEHESFEDDQVANFLNEHFVSVKLDREQRPDLDDIYMTGVQLLTGQGGWPMSSFLDHEGKPFFAGTYYPREHFLAVLQRIVEVWNTRREEVLKQAGEITGAIEQYTLARMAAADLRDDLVQKAAAELLERFDEVNGGFGGAPKFPNESMLLLLLEDWIRNGNEAALNASIKTLDKMCQGGIYDQVAGGFHRYTVDQHWLVPHFEKMLYNQAQLVRVYLKGCLATGAPAWRRIVEETVAYVLRDMTSENGTFFSATDADSEGEEGLFFIWTPDEIDNVLQEEDALLVKDLYGVTSRGNFEGRNILHLEDSLESYAAEHGFEFEEFSKRLERIRERLYEVREARTHPVRDEKVITAWNGMMITSIALAGFELGRDDFLEAARSAADRVWTTAWSDESGLWRIVLDGRASIAGNLEDYACLAEAMLTLYTVSGEHRWLERGERLVRDMIALFRDEREGGFYLSRDTEGGPLILRPKSPTDGATASGNSVALSAMVLLSQLTDSSETEAAVNECLAAFSGLLVASPSSFAYMVLAAEEFLRGSVARLQFAGAGHVRVHARAVDTSIVLDIAVDAQWHLNEMRLEGYAGTVLGEVDYPAMKTKSLGFQEEPVDVYEGRLRLEAQILNDASRPVIALRLQACDEHKCLAPETLVFGI